MASCRRLTPFHRPHSRLLDEAAVDAVKAWRFAPASLGGVPVTAALDVPVSFELTNR